MTAPIRPGAEPLSRDGSSALARIGILLMHGFTGSPVSMRPLAELLSRRGFAIEMPRLPGHGTTPRDLLPFRYSDFRAEAKAALERLRSRTAAQVAVGLSMGGTLVLDLGATEPLAGVVTINAQILDRGGAVVKLGPWIEKVMPMAPASAAGLKKNDIKKGGDEDAYDMVAAAAGNSLVRAIPEVRARLRQLTAPLLVIYSRDDHSVPPDNSKQLPGLVGTAREQVTVLELLSSYHVATLDNDLPLLDERIASFAESAAKSS
ncbi:MAG: alpha/beta fold hydrolase [Myxococcales bacterium]|nr:MAG: alpha/beta fold hydrolase [Myxococcales bacterium]